MSRGPDCPPYDDPRRVQEAAQKAVWVVIRQILIWLSVAFAVAVNGKMQLQITDLSKSVSDQSKTIANLTDGFKAIERNNEISRAIAAKVGARVPPGGR